LGPDGDAYRVTATDQAGRVHIIRAPNAFAAVCELAVQLGVDLADGWAMNRE